MTDPIEAAMKEAERRGEAAVRAISDLVGANDLQRSTLADIESRVRHGYAFIDIIVRSNGVETRHQADWIAVLLREMGR